MAERLRDAGVASAPATLGGTAALEAHRRTDSGGATLSTRADCDAGSRAPGGGTDGVKQCASLRDEDEDPGNEGVIGGAAARGADSPDAIPNKVRCEEIVVTGEAGAVTRGCTVAVQGAGALRWDGGRDSERTTWHVGAGSAPAARLALNSRLDSRAATKTCTGVVPSASSAVTACGLAFCSLLDSRAARACNGVVASASLCELCDGFGGFLGATEEDLTVAEPEDNSCSCCCSDLCAETLLVQQVPTLSGVGMQAVGPRPTGRAGGGPHGKSSRAVVFKADSQGDSAGV